MSRKQMLRRLMTVGMAASVIAAGTGVASALTIQGPSSSQTPYLVPTSPNVSQVVSIMTVGDSVNLKPDGVTPYRAVGLMDGLGAYDNGNGTFTVLMNHEVGVGTTSNIAATQGIARAHGNAGAFVSKWTIDKSTLAVVKIEDFIGDQTSIFLSNNVMSDTPGAGTAHTGFLAGNTTIIARLCSADLANPSAYIFNDGVTTYGTTARIFQSGEESGGTAFGPAFVTSAVAGNVSIGPEARVDFGRQFAFIATDDPNIVGNQANTAYELPHAGLFSWENNIANPLSQRKTIVAGLDDSAPGQVYLWVGDKQATGNVVERAGLTRQSANDSLYVVSVGGAALEDRNTAFNGSFQLLKSGNNGDVSGLTWNQLDADSVSKGGTNFLRPEDGQWDPSNPSDFYFVTTDRYDQVKDGAGAQVGRSRLYRLSFTDIANPELGGNITALLDGTEAGNMFDNMTINEHGQIIIQEDPGNEFHNAKVWLYDIATDTLTEILQHDVARFGTIGVAAAAGFSRDEESSGVIDVSHILGEGWYLATVQAHRTTAPQAAGGELVEGGQLLAFQLAIPEPTTLTLAGIAGLMLARRNRRIA